MKRFRSAWLGALLCATLLYLLQSLAFFYAPSFYFASLHQVRMPGFMKEAIALRFGAVAGLYLLWSLGLGGLNFWVLRRSAAEATPGRSDFLGAFFLAAAQTTALYLLTAWHYPAILGFVPGFETQALAKSYLQFAVIALACLSLALYWLRAANLSAIAAVVGVALLPASLHLFEFCETPLNLPPERAGGRAPSVLLLGFDALDGDGGNAALAQATHGLPGKIFRQAFTPLPATHPAWNSVLSGLYPARHGSRLFFDSPLSAPDSAPALQNRMKESFRTAALFAADQPETSYFTAAEGFAERTSLDIGWQLHLDAIFLNHFVFPALWLNHGPAERMAGRSLNSPAVFNFDLPRSFNFAFRRLHELPEGSRLLALHTCHLHSPIRPTRRELLPLDNLLKLAPRDFTYWRWSKPGDPLQTSPSDWHNPYWLRRPGTLRFLADLVEELKEKGYFAADTVVFLSDHGERFVPGYEIYGGIHGIDAATRAQNNVMLGIFSPRLGELAASEDPVSLVDVAPSVLALLGLEVAPGKYDGQALFDAAGTYRAPAPRPLPVESMGLISSASWAGRFPQIPAEELEASLRYDPDGRVRVGADYYQKALERKEVVDVSRTPGLWSINSLPANGGLWARPEPMTKP